MLQDHKPKECAIKKDDIFIIEFIKVEHNIQGRETRKYGPHMEENFKLSFH
jgi:hypothetical protein